MTSLVNSNDAMFLRDKRVAFVGRLGGVTRREAKQLVRAQGGVTEDTLADADLIVIGADELPLFEQGDWLDETIQQKAAEGVVEIIGETQLWQRMGLIDQEKSVRKLYTPAMLAELIGVSVEIVRRWHRRGLIVPAREVRKLPYFDFLEVSSARNLARLVAAGVSPRTIESKLSQLAQFVPDVNRPLAQLSVIVEGKELLLRRGEGLLEPGGQLRIDFDIFEEHESTANRHHDPAEVTTLRMPSINNLYTQVETPESMLELAESLEDDCQFEQAAETYRTMLLAFGSDAEINFQLAELLYRMGETQAARERYYAAVELDEEFVEARANLGCVLAELNQLELAVSAFKGALIYHPDYPDVHFHLARVYDSLKQRDEAEKHWQTFIELSPESSWADEAIARLEQD
jgi:tetratricopeptide (TPR) repeat protein